MSGEENELRNALSSLAHACFDAMATESPATWDAPYRIDYPLISDHVDHALALLRDLGSEETGAQPADGTTRATCASGPSDTTDSSPACSCSCASTVEELERALAAADEMLAWIKGERRMPPAQGRNYVANYKSARALASSPPEDGQDNKSDSGGGV